MTSPEQQPFQAVITAPNPADQWMGCSAPALQPSPTTGSYPPPPAPPVPSMYLRYLPVPAGGLPGRLKAATYAIGALLAISIIGVLSLAAGGNFMSEVPHREGLGVVVVLLVFGAFWLGGGVWMGIRAGWGWAISFWLVWPVTMPIYIYQAVRGGHAPPKPRFPTVWVFIGFGLVTAGFIIGAAFFSNPAVPRPGETAQSGRQAAAGIGTGATPTIVATATDASPPRPTPTHPSDRSISYDPVAIRGALRDEAVLPSENPGSNGCDLEARYDDEVVQSCDQGEISYLVFSSDDEAAAYVLYDRSPSAFLIERRGRYPTDIMNKPDGEVAFLVAVGNVVVTGTPSEDADQSPGGDLRAIERRAADLASLGIERLERLGGQPRRPPGTTL